MFYADGGWSWSVPWIAGLYALACQAQPDIIPEIFWSEALKTGRTIRIRNGGEELELGTIVDPVVLIERLRRKTAEPNIPEVLEAVVPACAVSVGRIPK